MGETSNLYKSTRNSLTSRSTTLGFGVGLLSAAVLMVELLLTRLFSVTLYYHFAFMAVAVAMLGLGAGGLLVYLHRDRFPLESLPKWLNALSLCLALAIVLVLVLILNLYVPAEVGTGTAARLVLLFTAATVPFLFAGGLFSLLVWRFALKIHRIYYYDLVGAALGSLAVLPALELLGAPNAMLVAALLASASSLFVGWSTSVTRSRIFISGVATLGLLVILASNMRGNLLDVRYAKGASTAEELYARWNALSRVCVHPGSRSYWIRIDCDAATEVSTFDFWKADRSGLAAEFSAVGEDLAHVLRPGARTLVIGSGGGRDVARALAHGSHRVVAVEINPLIARDLMLGFLREDSHRLFERPEVELVVDDARSVVQRSAERFDVIQSTLIDTWASTAAGAFALTESYLYTEEAFEQNLRHLSPDGILIVTRWEFMPPRQALRVVSVGRAAMEKAGIAAPSAHFLVVENIGESSALSKVSVLMKRSSFTAAEIQKVRDFLTENQEVRALYLPESPEQNAFFSLLRAPDLRAFAAQYPYDISPIEDSRPFFFFTTRWSGLFELFQSPEEDLKNNLGLFALAVSILTAGLGVSALFLLPRWFLSRADAGRASTIRWLYFLAIGAGYIIAEIALIQTFILFLGHPIYGMTVVVFSLLVGSGLGSQWSGRLHSSERATLVVPMLLAFVLAATHLVLLRELLAFAQPFSRNIRVLLSVLFLAPLGFLMGIPFPTGVRSADKHGGNILPWLWSANAGGSVFGSVVAIVLALTIGIPGAGAVGSACYLFAALAAYASTLPRPTRADST